MPGTSVPSKVLWGRARKQFFADHDRALEESNYHASLLVQSCRKIKDANYYKAGVWSWWAPENWHAQLPTSWAYTNTWMIWCSISQGKTLFTIFCVCRRQTYPDPIHSEECHITLGEHCKNLIIKDISDKFAVMNCPRIKKAWKPWQLDAVCGHELDRFLSLFVYLTIYPSIHPLIHPSTNRSILLSMHPPIQLSFYLCTCDYWGSCYNLNKAYRLNNTII